MNATTRDAGFARFESVLALLLFFVHAGLQIALFATHLPWQDEGQAWYWARALQQPIDFLIVPGEGHPPLWYLLLRLLSGFVDFDRARLLTLVLAMINGGLVIGLFRRELSLAALVLLSGFALHFWGYQFRPYTVIFTLTLLALLFAQAGHRLVGTWLVAVACGFHFFAGFLFAFWLAVAWRGGLRLRQLLPPLLLALGFGLTTILSGQGNSDLSIVPSISGLILAVKVFAAPFALVYGPLLLDAVVIAALIGVMFRRDPATLAVYFVVAALFCLFAAFVYGRYGWHIAFLIVLLLMAYATSEPRPHPWPFFILLLPSLVFGLSKSASDILTPAGDGLAFQAIVRDAGTAFDPGSNLLVWPDVLILGIAARTDMPFISANSGAIGGPVRLRDRSEYQIERQLLTTLPHPYWLICHVCTPLLDEIEKSGRTPITLYEPDFESPLPVGAYRIR